MKELRTEIDIAASPEAVWKVLLDFAAFPQWNPFIQEASGERKVGSRLRVRIVPPGSQGMIFKPVVTVCEPNREFRWLGKLGFRGIFDGEHAFKLEPIAGGQTRLVQSEIFTGVLVPLLAKSLDNQTKQGFEAMNAALKKQVERRLDLQ